MLTAKAIEELELRGLDVEPLVVKFGIESSERHSGNWISIPYVQNGKVVNHKYRRITKSDNGQNFDQDTGGVQCFWNEDILRDRSLANQPLVITEGEVDCWSAIQSGWLRSVSVPNGAPAKSIDDGDSKKYNFLKDAELLLRDCREIILAVDSDGAGTNLLNDLAIRLGKYRCKWVKYPKGCKDLNDALVKWGAKGVTETLKRAEWMRVDGVFKMSDLPPVPDFTAYDIGIPGMEDHYRVRMCDFSVITGIPSHGKSAFVNDLCCRLAQKYGWVVAFGSFEQLPQIDHRRNLRRWFCRGPVAKLQQSEIEEADKWIDKHFVFLVPSEDDEADLTWALERMAVAIVQYGAKVAVIDPWNELDHLRPPEMSLTEYVGYAIKQFKKFARKYQIHLIVVAHPAKMRRNEDGQYPVPSLYDISDSSHWFNKPDIGIVIHRKNETETMIRVAKSRYHDIIGQPGDVIYRFNTYQGRYEWIDQRGI